MRNFTASASIEKHKYKIETIAIGIKYSISPQQLRSRVFRSRSECMSQCFYCYSFGYIYESVFFLFFLFFIRFTSLLYVVLAGCHAGQSQFIFLRQNVSCMLFRRYTLSFWVSLRSVFQSTNSSIRLIVFFFSSSLLLFEAIFCRRRILNKKTKKKLKSHRQFIDSQPP